mgnify:FL=1
MDGWSKRQWRVLLAVYLCFLLFLMFFAFNRLAQAQDGTMRFSFVIYQIPLSLPALPLSGFRLRQFLFSLGNVVLFSPFGALLPLSFPKRLGGYGRAASVFLVSITLVELLQMITRLGSFDLEDILVNFLGFSIGFLCWRFCRRRKSALGRAALFLVLLLAFTALLLLAAEGINAWLFW